jgi:hypothetical protein
LKKKKTEYSTCLVLDHVANSIRPRYAFTYDHEKTKFLKAIEDPELRESTRHRLPTKEALRSAAWASREVPPAPKSLDNLDLTLINRPASKTSKGIDVGDYLLAQELNYGVILLGTAPLAKAFSRSQYKSMDATFKICPKGWYQVLLFLAQVNGVFLTCMMAVMPKKSKRVYSVVCKLIEATFIRLNLDTDWTRHFMMCDFEIAMREAFIETFPAIIIIGCYFHWSQLIIKRVKTDGFASAYRQNKLFGSFVRRVSSLPFVPSFLVNLSMVILTGYVAKLKTDDPATGSWAENLIKYIKETWFTRYNVQDWNVFDVNCQLLPITNNPNEGEKSTLNSNWPVHPQIFVFLMHAFTEFDVFGDKLVDIREGKVRHGGKDMFKLLKIECEAAKDSLIEDLNHATNLEE